MAAQLKSIFPCLPSVERGNSKVLGGDPKGVNFTYTNGKNVIVRNVENPAIAYTYSEHSAQATVAKYAPSGFYIASADASGTVRVWDTTQEEHILKYEYKSLGGSIRDLCWSPDSKRIGVCGEGRDSFARVFLWDSGSSAGSLDGHSKTVNSLDFRSTRPFSVVTAGEDGDNGYFLGPPFKLAHFNKDHSNFVNIIRFNPDGSYYLTGSSDRKAILYDGKTGTKVRQLGSGDTTHDGSIFGLSWSNDGKRVITASGDKTVKLWDVEANTAITTFTFGDDLEFQQLGCLWQGNHLLSVSLNGQINYLDVNTPHKPLRTVTGQVKPITSLSINHSNDHFFTGSYDGRIVDTDIASGNSRVIKAGAHSVLNIKAAGDNLSVATLDDKVRSVSVVADEIVQSSGISIEGPPKGLDSLNNITVAASPKELVLIRGGAKVFALPIKYEAQAVSIKPNGSEVVVGSQSNQLYFYNIVDDSLVETKVVKTPDGPDGVRDLAYSPDGNHIASADGKRDVSVYDANTGAQVINTWQFHTSKVNTVAWTPDSKHIASGSLDTGIIIWSLEFPNKRIILRGAHPTAEVTRLQWLNNETLLSSGRDACVRQWAVKHVA